MKISIKSKKLGCFEVNEERLIIFKDGLLGFPEAKRYAFMENDKQHPFFWIQAVEDLELTFVVTDPLIFKPDYRPEIPEEELQDLQIHDASTLIILAILSIPHEDPLKLTANLQAPLAINSKTCKGKQIVLNDDCYDLREPVIKNPTSNIS